MKLGLILHDLYPPHTYIWFEPATMKLGLTSEASPGLHGIYPPPPDEPATMKLGLMANTTCLP